MILLADYGDYVIYRKIDDVIAIPFNDTVPTELAIDWALNGSSCIKHWERTTDGWSKR